MELSKALRTAYFTLLNGNILSNENAVPVYDSFGKGAYPYIILSTQTAVQRGNKHSKIYEATLLIDIVTGNDRPTGRGQSEDIAEQVENIINPGEDITVNGYQIISTLRGSDGELTDKKEQYYIYRKLIRYNHLISKL